MHPALPGDPAFPSILVRQLPAAWHFQLQGIPLPFLAPEGTTRTQHTFSVKIPQAWRDGAVSMYLLFQGVELHSQYPCQMTHGCLELQLQIGLVWHRPERITHDLK